MPRPAPMASMPRQQSATGSGTIQQVQSVPVGSGPTIAAGRPVRKRKQPGYAEDMIPSDVLSRRFNRPKLPPPQPPPPPPPRHATPMLSVPMAAALAAAQAAQAAAPPGSAANMHSAIQLVTVPAPGGGTMTGLAIPPGALLNMPPLLQQQLRAQGIGVQQPGPPPYRLLPVVQPPDSSRMAVPAVKMAGPRDVSLLARRLDEEERRKAQAAAEARGTLRSVPNGLAATRVSKPPSSGAVQPAGGVKPPPANGSAAGRSKARSILRPRKPTPERRPDLPPGTWHPGFEALGGITHVHVQQAAAAPPLAAAVTGTAARCSQLLALDPQQEYDLSDDPLRASLQFLQQSARSAGRQPPYKGAVRVAVAAEQRLYQERLGRAHLARDGRRLAEEPMVPRRKSVRMRVAPEVLMPPPPAVNLQQRGAAGSRSGKVRQPTPKPEDATDVRRGARYQAVLPAVQPRPTQPPASEARWVAGLACQAADAPAPPQHDPKQAAAMAAATPEKRAAWVAAAHRQLVAALGDARAAAMGLLCMGAEARGSQLSDAEEAGFEAGMREFGRAFHSIRQELVPGRTVAQLQSYYYNVWKLRATPRSRAWYREKGAQQAAQQAEVERQQRAVVAEQEAHKERQDAKQKRRMLREVVQWVKSAAHAPADIQHRPVLMQRAQRAAKLLGSMNAPSKGEPGAAVVG
ncbi:hypothetical protein D9Q98_001753 [Chlorella vulgaris]|uniref:SANT domain-containing protein n=1 Tax=Chlorella vulgaris TaxID=3077 RepID=A0A9D4TVJ3_CHLVU|nr:hypothetical protein D9Q98_001753 [Chlorella vulgaris]